MANCPTKGQPDHAKCKNLSEPNYKFTIEKQPPIQSDGVNIDIGNIYGDLMSAVRRELDIEFAAGRIKGSEYSEAIRAYIPEIMKSAIEFSTKQYEAEKLAFDIKVQGIRTAKEVEKLTADISKLEAEAYLAKEQVLKTQADKNLACVQASELEINGESKRALECVEQKVKEEMVELYKAQTKGFVDKSANDAFRSISNMWAVFASEMYDGVEGTPSYMSGGNMDKLIGSIKNKTGL